MIRGVAPIGSFRVIPPGVKSVIVEMDKEAFDYLLRSYKAAHKWAVLKAKIDNEMLRIKGVGMTVAYNKVLHMMKLLEES
jgi:hypothetical protein